MKRKYGRLLLSLALMVGTLFGCSTKEKVTPESLLKESIEASNKLESFNMDMVMDFDLELESNGIKVPLDMALNLDCDLMMEPVQASMDLGFEVNMFGQSEKQSMEMYFVNKDGQILGFMTEGNGWESNIFPSSSLESMKGAVKQDFTQLFDMTTLKLEETDEKIDNKPVYLLKGKIKSDYINNATSMLGEEQLPFDFKDQMLECQLYIYKDNKMPARMVLDMESMMSDLLKQALALENEENINIKVNECAFNVDYKKINEIKSIEVPEEAWKSMEVIDF